jgi:hypothetical protein
MADINSTLPPLLEPVAESIHVLVNSIQFILGGLFGLYLVMVVLRWYNDRKLIKLVAQVRDEVQAISRRVDNLAATLEKKRR